MAKKQVSGFTIILGLLSKLLPGDYAKTFFYLNFIYKPRKFIRDALNSFYRMDHIYEVLREFSHNYKGDFTVLEFGVAAGYSFHKHLYAVKYLGLTDRVTVHGFDTFQGMPAAAGKSDLDVVDGDHWVEGQFSGSYEELDSFCRSKYSNYGLHKGLFEDTLSDEFLETLKNQKPILVWIDCDYYSSTKAIFERLIPYLPTGCVIYFDEPEFNFGSRFFGESRCIYEINEGKFGPGIELVLDTNLSLNSKRIYRFINAENEVVFESIQVANVKEFVHYPTNGSPLP